jgi:murein DD-endopeptidase MepM/ murein hydrolase activator NlpD
MRQFLSNILSYCKRQRKKHISFVFSSASSGKLTNLRISYFTLHIIGTALLLPLICGGLLLLMHLTIFSSSDQQARLAGFAAQEECLGSLTAKLQAISDGITQNQEFFAQLSQLYDVELQSQENSGVGGLLVGVDAKVMEDTHVQQMVDLYNQLSLAEYNGKNLFTKASKQKHIMNSTPSLLPTEGHISSGFGWRINPLGGGPQFHTGIDINAEQGTNIYATADGVVIIAGMTGGYGNEVRINHGLGFTTLYAHCSQIFVTVGQEVKRGDLIAAVGCTGWATGPHLHYEVRINNVPVDPMAYIVTGNIVD